MRVPEASWKRRLNGLHQLLNEAGGDGKGRLRFNSSFVKVSEIAAQYYCEKKVELTHFHGEVAREEMKIGSEGHAGLLTDSEVIELEAAWREIFAGGRVGFREMVLAGKQGGVVIVGVADAVFFYEGRPVLLLEYKFSRRQTPFRDHHVQARLYCHLLELMGFDVSQLKYALVMTPPGSKGSSELRKIQSQVLKHLGEKELTVDLESGAAHVYLHSYLETKSLEEADWALGFWRKERDSVPTNSVGKCRVCEFKDTCEYSLDKQQAV